jgi:hypothetical protein
MQLWIASLVLLSRMLRYGPLGQAQGTASALLRTTERALTYRRWFPPNVPGAEKGRPQRDGPSVATLDEAYFLGLQRRPAYPAKPMRPLPKRSTEPGSGTNSSQGSTSSAPQATYAQSPPLSWIWTRLSPCLSAA